MEDYYRVRLWRYARLARFQTVTTRYWLRLVMFLFEMREIDHICTER